MTDTTPRADGINVGSLEDFPVGELRIVKAGGRLTLGILRTTEEPDAVYALLNACPHRGAPICMGDLGGTMLPSSAGQLEYGMEQQILRCPWHGYEFDVRTGEQAFSDLQLRLRTFPVTVEDGQVYVMTSRPRRETTVDAP